MAQLRSEILKGSMAYHLSKIAPKNTIITLSLKNGLAYNIRARTMDRSVVKEVWVKEIYNKHGVKVEKGDTVVDIGAHIGVFSIYAAELSQIGKIYAFEPFKDNYKMLENNKAINKKENLFIFNKAISDKEETTTLYLSPDNNTGGHSIYLKKDSQNKVEIKTIPLTKVCSENNINRINFLKLDCEGAEFNILKADESILSRIDKIIMECHPFENNTVNSMILLLEKNGFTVKVESDNSIHGIAMIYAHKVS